MVSLYEQWLKSTTTPVREEIWHKMLEIYSEQVFSIGIVNGTFQPVVVANKIKNVPDKGIWNYNPGAFFGIYSMDTFWVDQSAAGGS